MPFVLDLLRHGDALAAAAGGDDARPLSSRGRADLERLAEHLAAIGWRPDRAFASPLLRARDSAALALRRAAPGLPVEVLEELRPEADPAAALTALAAAVPAARGLLVVAHQPLLGLLAGLMTGGPAPAFAPGQLLRVEFAGPVAAGAGALGRRLTPGAAP